MALLIGLVSLSPALNAMAELEREGDGRVQLLPTKTVTSASISPNLSLTLAPAPGSVIPGDQITYTATLANTGSTLSISGDIAAANRREGAAATVASFFDVVEILVPAVQHREDGSDGTWTPFAVTSAQQPGYTPVLPAPTAPLGLNLSLTPVPTDGVIYPASGSPVIGTTIARGATATWHYTATLSLAPAQLTALLDHAKDLGLRNSFHIEPAQAGAHRSPDEERSAGQVARVDFTERIFGEDDHARGETDADSSDEGADESDRERQEVDADAGTPQSGTATNLSIKIVRPTGPPATFDSSTVPGLASLAPGATVQVSAPYTVPLVPAKGAAESDAAYIARLAAIEAFTLTASASAMGSSPAGPVSATATPVSSVEHLPILGIAKSGPTTADAGTTATYPIALNNAGGAPAQGLSVTDTVPGGGTGSISGAPATLAPSATATAQATFTIPGAQPVGGLTDTAAVTWQDANANPYGPVSSNFTTLVTSTLRTAHLVLSPSTAGPDLVGTTQTLTANLLDSASQPLVGKTVTFTVTGPNATSGTGVTDSSGNTSFTYTGNNPGTDTVQAGVTASGFTLHSNTSTVGWIKPVQPIMTTTVQGNFFAEDPSAAGFVAKPGDTPAFGQSFPAINFDPPPGTVNHNVSGVDNSTRPFTDVTTDLAGNFSGTIVAQGNGKQAGVGPLNGFDAAFTANFVVNKPGDITFNVVHDDGFILGVGGGATRVNGVLINPPGSTPFKGYGVVGANNTGGFTTDSVTVHFPAAGSYPFELDYSERAGGNLTLVLTVASFVPQTSPLSIYVGYADGLRPAGSVFPFPWQGSPGVSFEGCTGCTYETGAIRFDNSSDQPITLDSVTVDIGNFGNNFYSASSSFGGAVTNDGTTTHFNIWPTNRIVPAHGILILTQEVQGDFDTSDVDYNCSPVAPVKPKVNVAIGGATTTYVDSGQVLNTLGIDGLCRGNESASWQRIGGGGTPVNIPLPPAASLSLTPGSVSGNTVGQQQNFQVAAMDGSGQPLSGLPVTLGIFGANTQQLNATTDSTGIASFSYVGRNAGTDTVSATAFITGFREVSNTTSVPWNIPIPGGGGSGGTAAQAPPSITDPLPVDGSIVTKPVPVSATFTPPAGQTIATWSVTYQAQDPEPPVTLAQGVGSPPSPITTFDPTLLANDTYVLTFTATASGGGTQSTTTTVAVKGNLKLGRYRTTYQDLNVPVNGFQMQVRRTYDSYDKRVGDFGVGWRVDVANFRTSANRQLGAGGWTLYPTKCVFGLCFYGLKTSAPHYVTVAFPDGHQEIFDWTPTAGAVLTYWQGASAFTPRPGTGTTSKLEDAGDPAVSYDFAGNIRGASGIYNPTRFKLTTHSGQVLILDTATGLVSETDAHGNSLNIDAAGVHASNGQSITFTRDGLGRITDMTGPSGQHLTYTYSAAGDLASSTDPKGNAATYTYDSSHRMLNSSGPGGVPFQTLAYSVDGRLSSVTDANGNTSHITDNVAGQQQTVVDPAGRLTMVMTMDDLGDVIRRDYTGDASTVTYGYQFDSVGHLTRATDPLGHATNLGYDSVGDLTLVADSLGNASHYAYDSLGHLLTVIAPDGTTSASMTYDSVGNLTKVTRVDGSALTYTYDSSGRLLTGTDPNGKTQTLGYDAAGHLTSTTDPLGNTTHLSVDSSGRITGVTDALGATVSVTYDANGNQTGLTDGLGQHQAYAYDAFDRLTSVTDAAGHTSAATYDNAGRLVSATDRNGQASTFGYDADSRLVSRTLATETTSYTYNALGDVTSAGNPAEALNFAYDAAGRAVSQATVPAAGSGLPAATLGYNYDAAGRLTSATGPDGSISYAYDVNSRLTQLTDPAGGAFHYSYDATRRLSGISRPNGVSDAMAYDVAGNLASRTSTLGATPVSSSAYTYDANGRRISFTDPSGTSNYGFNASGELTSASHPATPAEAYGYDGAGNRTAPGSKTYAAGDRLTADTNSTYVYDAAGNLTSRTDRGTGAVTHYSWNARHQLLGITFPDSSQTTYRYDPLGRRIESNVSGQVSRDVWDGSNVRLSYDGTGALGSSYVDAGVDGHMEQSSGGQRLYYLQDGTNSTAALTNDTGAVVARYSYDSFGQPASSNPSSPANRYTYTGREYDAKSGLYYYRSRYYAPAQGRFLSEDPLGGVNPYSYTGNDPVNFADPSGALAVEYGALLDSLSAQVQQAQCISGFVGTIAIAAGAAVLAAGTQAGAALSEAAGSVVVAAGITTAQCVAASAVLGVGAGRAAAEGATNALSFDAKISGQLADRGWTEQTVQDIVGNHAETHSVWDFTSGSPRAATAYANGANEYVVVNNASGNVVQVSNINNPAWKPVWEDPRFQR